MTTYSDGTIRKRNVHGSWQWQGLITVYGDDGTKRQRTKLLGIVCDPLTKEERGSGRRIQPKGKGARQALTALKEWHDELVTQDNEKQAAKRLTVAQTATTKTVPEYVQYYWDSRDIEPGTRQHYSYLLKHINCPIMQIPITDLTPTIVQEWKKWMADKEELGASMQNKCFNQLKYACKWGVEMQQLKTNPCSPVKAPRRSHHEPNPLDKKQLDKLKDQLKNLRTAKPTLSDIATLALMTGMRQGELCALRWDDIDGSDDGSLIGHIHVNNAIARKDKGSYLKPYPKNRERRDIPITKGIRGLLTTMRDEWLGYVTDLHGVFLFAYHTSPETFPSPQYIGKQWNMFASMSGIVGVEGNKPRFHDLRDTFATLALTSGQVDVATLAGILGHRDTATTLRHYARWVPSANAEAMDRMDDIMS